MKRPLKCLANESSSKRPQLDENENSNVETILIEEGPSRNIVSTEWGEDFSISSLLGEGMFGKVFLVENNTNRRFAMKVIKLSVKNRHSAWDMERKIMEKVSAELYEHIVRMERSGILKTCPDSCSPYFFLFDPLGPSIFDLMQNGKKDYPGKYAVFETADIAKIGKQILSAMQKLDELKILHLDLKPENVYILSENDYDGLRADSLVDDVVYILLSKVHVKIGDFGCAVEIDEEQLQKTEVVQTQNYRAPEVIMGLPYGPKADVWSYACILAEIYIGDLLFYGSEDGEDTEAAQFEMMQRVVRQAPSPRMWREAVTMNSKKVRRNDNGDYFFHQSITSRHISTSSLLLNLRPYDRLAIRLFELIRNLLIFDPKMRPSFADIGLDNELFTFTG
uniref:Protein kinase domain-containing protein n=1 Tax=Caenorhabditis japonica TaxID=281687 RepID=A0A8R1E2K1_CAEJA